MKAMVATGNAALVELAEVPEPQPAANEAVIRVEAFSVNRGEMFSLTGVYGTMAPQGAVLGQDVAGRVVKSAVDGSGPPVGTRVVAHPERAGWAQYVSVATDRLAELPSSVSTRAAATLPLAGLTALRMLRLAGPLAGARILLTGASGGVGHLIVELAANAGAQVTAVSASPQRGERLAELGAAHVVHTVDDAPGRYDIICESVGGDSFTAALRVLTPGGLVLWFGQASHQPVTLDFFSLFDITPFTLRHFPNWVTDQPDRTDLQTLVRLVAEDRLHPEIGRVADWTDTGTVLREVYERKVRGNAVLTINDTITDELGAISQDVDEIPSSSGC